MKLNPPILQLERKIDAIRRELLDLGPMHPGSVSRQYQVCGNPTCRCMQSQNPQRHGPYHKLAYVYHGKPVCRFIRADCVAELLPRLAAYKAFRKLTDQWIKLSIQRGQMEFFNSSQSKRKKLKPGFQKRPRPIKIKNQ